MVYCRNEIVPGIEVVENRFGTIVWLNIDKLFFHTESDIYLCGVYIWGEDSPAYNVVNVDLFECVQEIINYLNQGVPYS